MLVRKFEEDLLEARLGEVILLDHKPLRRVTKCGKELAERHAVSADRRKLVKRHGAVGLKQDRSLR